MKKIIKRFFVSISKKNSQFRIFLRKSLFYKNKRRYNKICKNSKINEKLILFESYSGRNYSDSPKSIYLELLNNKKYRDYEFVWIFKKIEDYQFLEENRNTKVVKFGSLDYLKAYAEAKYWIVNSRISDYIYPNDEQLFVQCWHGTPLKKLGFDIKVEGGNAMNSIEDIREKYESDAMKYNYFISPSKFCTDKFTSSFNLKAIGKENIIIETGYPRNDFLYSHTKNNIEELKNKLGIPIGKKTILYAPTWRDNQHISGVGYTYELGIDLDKMQEELADDFVLLFRTHYFVANSLDLNKYEGFIYNLSDYDDITDLYIISDLLITDYSSVFFDYANLKRPILFYMYDLEEYQNKLRDFYISLEELPGPIVEKEEDLILELKKISEYFNKYSDKYKKFNAKFNYLDDENSSKRVIDNIIKR